jgi:PAS domain S-box-containing protein
MQKQNEIDAFHEFCNRAKAEIQQSNSMLRDAIEALPHAFYVIDAESYIIQLANSATAIFGQVNEGSTCHSLTHNSAEVCDGQNHICPLQQIKKTKKPVTLEHIHYDKNNTPRHYEVHAYPICDKNGEVIQMIEYSLDITDRKKAEDELRLAHAQLEDRVKERTKELEHTNEALRQAIIKHQQTEHELHYHQKMLQSAVSDLSLGEERQRRAIAIDLHDGIGQALALTQMRLAEVNNLVNEPEIASKLEIIYSTLEQTIRETRTLTFEISPPLLYEIGLEAAIDWLLERFQEQHNIKTFFQDDGSSKDLHEDIRIILYRIVRELLINVTKHARAKIVNVSIKRMDQDIHIRMQDDGIGFDIATMNQNAELKQSFGLFSISERLKVLGGEIEIKSKPKKGTVVDIKAPLKFKQRNFQVQENLPNPR